jgi:hypothetical protein
MPYHAVASASYDVIMPIILFSAFLGFCFFIGLELMFYEGHIQSYIFHVKQIIRLLAKSGYRKETIIKVVRFYDPPSTVQSE